MEHVQVRPTQAPVGAFERGAREEKERPLVDQLLEETVDAQGLPRYSARMNSVLAITSAWAYADAETLSNVLHRHGLLDNRCDAIGIENDALFVHAHAFLIQSQCGRLGILCFRGTEPSNAISWMVDASVDPRLFSPVQQGEGEVHGGFYRNVEALWPSVLENLEKALGGNPLFTGNPWLEGKGVIPLAGGGRASAVESRLRKLEALFITGHSLGGAMAALAAAVLHNGSAEQLARSAPIRQLLRGVYTYGQPMVGDAAFARRCAEFSSRVFRHVYKNDIVPRMPPKATGSFKHFGREYRWHDKTRKWEISSSEARQVRTIFLSSLLGVFDWFKQQIASLRKLGLVLPYSWEAHSPVHYIDTTLEKGQGSVGAPWV